MSSHTERTTMHPGEVTITPPAQPAEAPPAKFYVAPKGELTEDEALTMGYQLFDAIAADQARQARATD